MYISLAKRTREYERFHQRIKLRRIYLEYRIVMLRKFGLVRGYHGSSVVCACFHRQQGNENHVRASTVSGRYGTVLCMR